MNAHNRTVDHLYLAVVRLDDAIHQAIPDACFAPAVETIVGGRIRPIPLRQIPPWRAGAQNPKYAVENAAIVAWLAPSTVLGHKRFDKTPLKSVSRSALSQLRCFAARITVRSRPLAEFEYKA